jgi:hypothetical protein
MNQGGSNATLPLRRLEKFDGMKKYIEGLKKGSVASNDETSQKIGEEYETRNRNAEQIKQLLRTPQGQDELLGSLQASFEDAKFAVINKPMTLTDEGSRQLRERYKELVHWKGSHI